ncbi:MAG: AmmeMemoRadiSam system radical SAM enzyme [candidate division Zixibacteria bacterium]|nr:AmmeMemoRadiSam system radical SAM enzyme [Candidatus Tariuqbacter arcticus]
MTTILESKKSAPFYSIKGNRLVCEICPRFCKLKDGQEGLCRGRRNIGGKLYAVNYGETASIAMDPIEKKPLYHFHPGEIILSVGPNSCSFTCKFCQNYQISQQKIPTRRVTPEELAAYSRRQGSIGVAYTYTEPLMWYEFLLDCGAEFHAQGMYNVLVTNGYVNPAPFDKLIPLIDAMNVDLKSMDDDFYRKLCGGVRLQPVLDTITAAHQAGIHIEITQLLITGENDSREQIERTVRWIADLGKDIPIHFSRYFPHYKFTAPATKSATLEQAYRIASQELEWVYVGNIALDVGNHSYCPSCGKMLVERWGYHTNVKALRENKCGECGREVYFRN